jgi:hypothetical protein
MFRTPASAAKMSLDTLKSTLNHMEAVQLTLNWVAEMVKRLPALEAAVEGKGVQGVSAREDVRGIKEAIKKLGYFLPEEAAIYSPAENLAVLRAELARREVAAVAAVALPPIETLTQRRWIKTDLPGKNGWRACED